VPDSVTFRFSGGDQFAVDLVRWRDRLRAEVRQAAADEANLMASVVQAQYPAGKTGKLRAGVRVKDESLNDTVLLRVRSLAPHSHLVEKGTAQRRTRRGWNRGVMPKRPLFIPEAIQKRLAFVAKIHRIMESPEPALGSGSPTVTGSL
jgi:hypothetical protein